MNNSILDQMLMKAAAPTPTSVGEQKQAAVAAAADTKKQAMGAVPNFTAEQLYPMMVGAQTGAGDTSAGQAELDARYMAPMDLWAKYGYNDATNALIGNRAEALQRLSSDQSIQRDWNQTAADTVSGIGLGAFNGLAGIGAWATGIVNRDAGNALSQGIKSVNEAVMDNQSPALQGRRRVNQALNFNDQRDSTQQYKQDLAAGESGFMAGAARIARDSGSSIANAAADPMTLLDGTAQAVGSLVGVGRLSRMAGAINSRGILAARKAGIIGADAARMLATAAEKGGTAALIGGMEAGGAFQQTANEVLGMDFPTLMKNPEFNKLVDEGLSMEEARATLANTAGLKAAAITAPAAIAMGKFVAKFEAAPMSAASMKSSLANIGTQVLEEAGQGGVSQMAGNKAIRDTADNTKTLSEGVGEQVGTGALFGGLMAGTTQAPGMAALAAQKAMARALSGKTKDGAPEEEPAHTNTPAPAATPSQSLVPMTTDLGENAKVAAQVSDAQEQLNIAATESIQSNPTLDDIAKAAQLNGMATLEAVFTFGDTDKQDVAQRLLPEELKAKLGTARNMPEAFVALTDHVVGMTDAIAQGAKPTAEFIQAVSYLNEMSDRVEGLASIPEISVIMEGLQEGTPESDYLSGIYQAMANIEGSQQVVAMQDAVRQRMAQAPILEQVSLDNIPEVHARAKYAPQTLAQNVIEDTLAMANAGQIKLSEAQRVRLMASQALVAAMAQGNVTDAVNTVSRQIAFNEGSEGGFKYPSLVEHTGSITKAVISGDVERAKNDMMHLRNFAQTMINKAAAINESAGTNKKVVYRNWIPRKNEWRQSATGLNADLKGQKSTAFAQRIYTEALLAQATYENMAAHFPALAEGVEALTGVPEMSAALQNAVRQYSAATSAPDAREQLQTKVKSRITEEQVVRLSDADLNARIEAIQDKKEKTEEDQATFAVLDAEMTKREDAAAAAQKAQDQSEAPAPVTSKQETTAPAVSKVEKKSPGVAAIEQLSDAEINARVQAIKRSNKPEALEKNTVYQALVAEQAKRSPVTQAAEATKSTAPMVKVEPSAQVSKELAMVNALAAKLKLPAVTAVREAAPNSGLRGAMYDFVTGEITVDPRLKGNARLSIILHELGHHVVSRALAQELSIKPEEVGRMGQDELLAAMKKAVPEVAAEYESWLAARGDVATMGRTGVRVPVSQSAMSKAVYSFIAKGGAAVNGVFGKKKRGVERTRNSTLHEWLADNIAKALESNEDTRGVIAQFFKRIAGALKKMYEALAPDSTFLAAKSVQDWLVALANKAQEIREPEVQGTVVAPAAEVTTPTATEQKSVLDGIDTLMPDLDGRPNVLVASFEPGSNPKSRIAGMAQPIVQVLEELGDSKTAEQIMGKKVSAEKRKAALSYVQNVVKALAEQTANRIDLTMMRKAKSGTRGTWLAMAATGQVPADHPDRAKAFQLLPNGGGALAAVMDYVQLSDGSPGALINPRLVESAALAAGQWYLSSGNSGAKKLDESAVSGITGVPQEMVNDTLISLVSQGMDYKDVIRGIADAITQAWNLRIKDDAPIAKAEAVINSMAAELFYSMIHGQDSKGKLSKQFFERVDILVDTTSGNVIEVVKDSDKLRGGATPEGQQLISRYLPRKLEEGQESISTVLPNLLGVPTDDAIYFDPADIAVSDVQQHSAVPLSRAEQKAQERQQQTGFTLNAPFMQIHSLFTDKDMIDLLGAPVDDTMNVVTRESAEGKNTTVMGGWNQVKNVVAQVTAEAESRGVAVDELPIYYRYESISTARSMMRGRYNPQSDKGMRQAFTSMQSEADLTDPDQKLLWDTAALQMTGARVYAMKPEDISPKADALFAEPEMVAAIDAIAQALQGNKDITGSSLVPLLKAAAAKTDDGLTNELIHVLVDRARYSMADEAGRKNFKSRLYIEADGVANGPAGAMAMLTAADSPSELGAFIRAAAKTGFFIGDPTMNMNQYRQVDGVDTYAAAGKGASQFAGDRLQDRSITLLNQNITPEQKKTLLQLDIQHRTVLDVMSTLMPDGSFKVSTNENGYTSLEISRKVTKNPVTITVYGSGKKGIAGKLAGAMIEEITDRISRAAKEGIDVADAFGGQEAFNRLMDQLQRLTVNEPGYKKGVLSYIWNPNSKKNVRRNLPNLRYKKDLQKFKFSPVEVISLVNNLTEFFVNELNSGIKSSLGSSVLNNSELMVQASNYQSLAAIHVYNTEMKQLIDSKVAENPDWDYVRDGFSKNDLKALRQKLKAVAPLLRTAMQAWDTSDSARVASAHVAGSTLSGEYPVQHLQRTPSMSGVRVAPFLVIGMGDAAMVTNLFNDMELPEGTMQVYDGINLPFIKAREGGVAANKAIAEAWLNNNPLRTLLESFEAVAKSVDMDAALATLAKTDPKQADMIANGPSAETVLERLREGAARIDALHAAIKEVGFSVDQMAATGATHSVEGTATAEDAEALLVEAYVSHLGAPIDKKAKEAVTSWLNDLPVDGSGNKVIYTEGLKLLAASDKFEPHHREMVRRILAVHADRLKDLQVVVATDQSDLSAFLTPAQQAALKTGAVNGYWIEHSKTLVLGSQAGSDTIAHELTHAATFQVLRQHYEAGMPDTKWGIAVDTAVMNLSSLLMQFYERGADGKLLNKEASKVFAGFQTVLGNILRTSETEPGASIASLWEGASQSQRAQAMAEFVAHVTTDDTLRSLAKSTLVKRIKDSVIRFLRMVVFGPLGLDVKSPLSDDILSQVQFHVEVISAAQADMARRGVQDLLVTSGDPLAQSTLLPNDTQAVVMSKAFEQRVGRYMAAAPSVFEAIGRATEALNATTMASDLATDAAAAGFLQTPAQRLAFTQMVAALSTQAKIAPAFAQASHKLYAQALNALDGKLTTDQQDFLRGRTGLRVDAHDRSSLVPAFVALGLVDPVMRNALSTVSKESRAKVEGNIDKRLEALGNNALAALQDMLTGANRSKNAEEALANMAEMIAKQAHIERNLATRVEAATMGAMGKANDWVANTLADKAQALSKAASAKAGKTKSKIVKAAAQTTALVANVFSDAGAAANAEAALSMVNRGKSDFLKGLVKDLTGRVESNALVYDLIKQVGQKVSKARQFYREQLPSVIAKAFSKVPSEEQSTTMFKTMAKTGLASLVQGDNFAAAFDMALDDAKRAAEIARIEGELRKETPRTEGRIRKKAKLLAEYMTTGVVQAGLLRNADAVANLLDDKVSGMTAPGVAEQSKAVVDLVDQLISLYAVDMVPAAELEAMRQLRSAEPEGTERVLGVLKHQMDADKARHTGAARFNAWKGYIPSDGAAGGSLIVADTRDHKNLTRKGYRKVADYKGTSLFKTAHMAYYYTPVGKAPFNQGIIQNARMTAGGVDQSTGFAVGFPTAGRITQKATVERLARNAHLDSSREALLAVYDDKGNVVAFERSIDPDQLERLKPSTNILAMLGQWMGRQAEEEMAQAVNFDAVTKVHEMWVAGKHRKGEFVNVLDAKSFSNDPVLKDALRILPADVTKHAESLFGTGRFMVRKDMLEDVFGYRDASIGDAWTGNSRWSPKTQERVRKLAEMYLGDDAFRLLVQGEERWKNLVKDAKTLIVVKSVIVPAANFVANIFQMLARGVPMSTIARGLRDKTLEVDFYVKTHVEQMDLAVQLMALGSKDTNQRQKLEARIQAIEDSWKRLSIWPLLAAGEFGSITDAGIGRDEILLSEGKLQAYIESKTEKLPPGLQRAGKWALITKDTALFQGLQKSMEYGDFLAKAVMYEHHLSKGKTKAEALGEITDEFVNYDRHPGRVRGYVEDLGLAWFYNYKLRIAKTAFSMLRKDPLRVALLAGMGLPGMELPVTENVFTKAIEGTLGHSIGPGMLFSAPGLNPWVAAMQ